MSNERLEEIIECINHDLVHNDGMMLSVHYGEIRWLIEQAKENQEMKEQNTPGIELELLNSENVKLEKQNKRYREALKFYANKDIYKLVNNGLTARVPIIYDCGKVANEVLKEESE